MANQPPTFVLPVEPLAEAPRASTKPIPGKPAPGRKLQAPPLPTDIRLYAEYLEQYEQYLLADRYMQSLENRLALRDPMHRVQVFSPRPGMFTLERPLNTPVGMSSRMHNPPPSRKEMAAAAAASAKALRDAGALAPGVSKGKAPERVAPKDAPAVSIPSGEYIPLAKFPMAYSLVSEALFSAENEGLPDPDTKTALGEDFVVAHVVRVSTPPPASSTPAADSRPVVPDPVEPSPKKAGPSTSEKKKAKVARRKAQAAVAKLAEMPVKELKELVRKEELLARRVPTIKVPNLFLTASGRVESVSGQPDKTQKAKGALRKRSPSYMRRLARRQLARYGAKISAVQAQPTKLPASESRGTSVRPVPSASAVAGTSRSPAPRESASSDPVGLFD
jgi:hypothetical protein